MRSACLLVIVLLFAPARLCAEEQPAGAAGSRGTLTGRFVFDGEPPDPQLVPDAETLEAMTRDTPLERDADGRAHGGHVAYKIYLQEGIRPKLTDESLLVGRLRGIANVVVFAVSRDIPWERPAVAEPSEVRVRMQNGNFVGRVWGMTFQQTLVVENLDPVPFVFQRSGLGDQTAREVAPRGEIRMNFSKAEPLPISIRAFPTGWANGSLLIHGNPYFAISDADGAFSIPNLPQGKWEFAAWHERAGYLKLEHWPKGRFQRDIVPGTNDLRTILVSPALLRKEQTS